MNPRNIWRASGALALAAALCLPGIAGAQSAVEETARRAATARLRPGDRVELQFRRDRELNAVVGVNERGEAVFPRLGAMDVSEMTIAQLQDTLLAQYSAFLRYPEVEINVLRRVTVNGEVKQPNVYLVDLTSSVRDAIARAGGILETGNRSKVWIVRDGTRIRVSDWDRVDGPQTDLLSGDQVLVGRKSWFTLNALPLVSTSVIVIGLIQSLRQNR